MIRTRWLVVVTLAVVAAIGYLVYRDELARSEAALGDLGDDEQEVARAALSAVEASKVTTVEAARKVIAVLERPDSVAIVVALAGDPLPKELGHGGDSVVRLDPSEAAALGLPERTAMVGIARDGAWTVAVARTARRRRDRDRVGRMKVVIAIVLSAGVVTALSVVIWSKQRSEAKLAHDLAVSEIEQSRDAELERLSRAATMAALGSGVAHELSTPLGVIVGRAEQIVGRASDERTAKAAQAILEQADYIESVVRGLLGLARGAPIALEDVAPDTVVADAFALVRHRFERKGVELVPHFDPREQLPAVRGEPLLLRHALVNLMLNACDASPPGGTVEVELRATAGEVTFAVLDEGDGIAPADVARAIEPFVTTKGHGTGLGLAIANEIAKTHRGQLALVPRSPKGTVATITVPV